MKNLKLKLLLLALLLPFLLTKNLKAQVDTDFWFAAPDVSAGGQGAGHFDEPIIFWISTLDKASKVTVSQPANPGFPGITKTIPANSTDSIDMTFYLHKVECGPPDKVLNYGIHITSTEQVTIYYEVASVACQCSPELFSLKGRNAVGTYFLIPTQTKYDNSNTYTPLPYCSFDIVATEDNTDVTIKPSHNIVGHAAGTTFTITLNKGQAYSASASSELASEHLSGSVVNATKPVAITYKDDLLGVTEKGVWGADLAGDQLIPVSVIGKEYIVVKGEFSNERVTILATEDNTDITIDGIFNRNMGFGVTYEYQMTNSTAYIVATKPIYVLHTSGTGSEVGSAIIPSIICTGSNQIGFVRTDSRTFILNLITHTASTKYFTVNSNTNIIKSSDFSAVPGTGGLWSFAHKILNTTDIPVNKGIIIKLTNGDVFHMGLINNTAGGCMYGYFSNFNKFTPKIDISNFCKKDTTYFSLTDTSNMISVKWLFGDPASGDKDSSILINPKHVYPDTGSYTVTTIFNSICGMDTNYQYIKIYPTPVVDLGNDTTICYGDPITLNAKNPGANYSWSTGSFSQTITIDTLGIFKVTVSNNCKSAFDSIIITKRPYKVDLGNDVSICKGDVYSPDAGDGTKYSWSTGEQKRIIDITTAGTYTVTAWNGNCLDSNDVKVTVNELPIITAGSDTIICLGDEITLSATGGITYTWTNTVLTSSSVKVTPTATTTYIVTGTDINNCKNTDDVKVEVKLCKAEITIPNIFTPNGDQKNDKFEIVYKNIKSFKITIFNRWGRKEFESQTIEPFWDGTSGGSECSDGVYYYIITYEGMNDSGKVETKQLKGTVTILR